MIGTSLKPLIERKEFVHDNLPTEMGKSEKERKAAKFKLKHPDRTRTGPSQRTLLELAEQHGLLKTQLGEKVGILESDEAQPQVGRLGESILWSLSLMMLHFTLDVLVSHQYAMQIEWSSITTRAAQALPSMSLGSPSSRHG